MLVGNRPKPRELTSPQRTHASLIMLYVTFVNWLWSLASLNSWCTAYTTANRF